MFPASGKWFIAEYNHLTHSNNANITLHGELTHT